MKNKKPSIKPVSTNTDLLKDLSASVPNKYALHGLNNEQQGKVYPVHKMIVVGRSTTCDIFIADVLASRQQARFYYSPSKKFVVEDLKSSNGTYVNGKAIRKCQLKEGDIIKLGNTEFQVKPHRTHSTVEIVDILVPQQTKIVKKASSVVFPSLNTMHTSDFLQAIGISKDMTIAENVNDIQKLQKKTRNFAVLFELSTLLQKIKDSKKMLTAVVDLLLKVPGGDVAHIMMLDDHQKLVPKVTKTTEGYPQGHFLLSQSICNYVLEKQCAVVAPDLRNDLRFSNSQSVMLGSSESILAVPIIMHNESRGLIAISREDIQKSPAEDDLDLLCIVSSLIGPALQNIELEKQQKLLVQEIEDTQREVVFTMGAIGETRSKETGNHVKRVAEYSKLLALLYGLDSKTAELLKQASPMHDIGKVGIPDSILNKPGKLTKQEWFVMKTHAALGYEMLKHSKRPILKAAAIVAREHHEKWDGSGYPRKLTGERIHIFGRITAVADVFDALGSERCYKKAWPLDRILKLFREERGRHFDPTLVDLLLNNLEQFIKIRDTYVD